MVARSSLLGVLLCLSALSCSHAAGGKFMSQFKQIIPLTSENYMRETSTKMGWLVSFGKGDQTENPEHTEAADELEAWARVGFVDVEKETELLKELGLTAETAPAWKAKPIGVGAKLADHEEAKAGVEAIISAIPEDLATIVDNDGMQAFVQSTIPQKKLPVVLLSDKAEVPKLFQKLSIWMGDRFSFAVLPNPPQEMMDMFQVKKLPFIFVYRPMPPSEKDPKMPEGQIQLGAAGYDRKQFGGLKFQNVIKFLATMQQEMSQMGFFTDEDEAVKKAKAQQSSKPAQADLKIAPLFEVTADTPDACIDTKLGMCIIGLLDGSPLNEEQKKEQLAALEAVQNSPSNKGRPLHFMWVDLTCHPKYAEYFGLSLENAPSVIAVSPKKGVWSQHVGGFEAKKIGAWITGVLGGKNRIGPMPGDKKVPLVSADDDCAAIHASMMPVEEEMDMDDIMAEMQADAEAKAAADAAAAGKEEDTFDAELEAKKQLAIKEMERLNKMSNKKKKGGGKKKKKKSKKKKTKAKTEL